MGRPSFESAFAEEIDAYLDYHAASGRLEYSFYNGLRIFDKFCVEHGISELAFTKEDAARWVQRRDFEASTTHYSRVNGIKHFLVYLGKKGYDVFITRDVKFKPTDFQPHIYADDEIERYFRVVDTYTSSRNRKDAVQYPVLFRLLYCCGTRINETLGIRKRDVDLPPGVIKLHETKNNRERLIVMGDDMKCLMAQFADRCFYMLADDGYIFTNASGSRLSGDIIYDVHREILRRAGIPFMGEGLGPRVHDWRHTMAVRSFKQMVDSGLDMYVALPILSTYLGHKGIDSTERYVRLTMSIYPHIEERFRAKIEEIFGGGSPNEED
jgi:integrase